MRFASIVSVFALSIGLAACGGSGGGDDIPAIDARTSDATGGNPDAAGGNPDAAGGANALGQLCSMTTACPAGNNCTFLQGLGSQTMGYCSPMCTAMGGECAAGYAGPGAPQCALTMQGSMTPVACAIVCTAPADCPSGLACTPVPGQMQPISICVVPA